jgi:hypothetical protein
MLDLLRLATDVRVRFDTGERLHRAALHAMHEGRWEDAERWFEGALARHRRDVEVGAIARVRVHQMMARVLAGAAPAVESAMCLEIERRLCQLDAIESLVPPFECVDAHSLLGGWMSDVPASTIARGYSVDLELARAA